MAITFKVGEGERITVPWETYDICHNFSAKFIVELGQFNEDNMNPALEWKELQSDNAEVIRQHYKSLVDNHKAVIFDQHSIGQVDPYSLILFHKGDICHSMIALDPPTTWVGCNNGNSLGNTGPSDRVLESRGSKVIQFDNMDNRTYVRGNTGGWKTDGSMAYAMEGSVVEVYRIPILQAGAVVYGDPDQHGCCC